MEIDVSEFAVNITLLVTLPLAVFFGVCFGLVVNRYLIVAYSNRSDANTQPTFPSRWGKHILSWKGLLILCFIFILNFLMDEGRTNYYQSVVGGVVPGLEIERTDSVKFMTLKYLIENKNPHAINSLIDFINNKGNGDLIRHAIYALAHYPDNPDAIHTLSNILYHGQYFFFQLEAAQALADSGDVKGIDTLLEAMQPKSGLAVFSSVFAIFKEKMPAEMEVYLRTIQEDESQIEMAIKWYKKNRDKLKWQEKNKRYFLYGD
ncbi:MAG: HEAT repeat domain-containing protein [Planctomycetota bacterium]|nr:MAG: HEAT repeat domain-containing protein [Planctomycetota bacterium]